MSVKKTLSEIFAITKSEIENPDKFVAVTSVVGCDEEKTAELVFEKLRSSGMSEIKNPSVYEESLPNYFPSIQVPDYRGWVSGF